MSRAIRVVALFEALKGLVVVVAGVGLLELVHRDVQALAARFIEHLHLNPASHLPQVFLQWAGHLQDGRLGLLAAGAFAYAALRLLEAYGLWRGRAWAEVLAAGSGAVYVPFEVVEVVQRPTALHVALLLVNLIVVGVMVRALQARRGRG